MVTNYLKNIFNTFNRGDAREESYCKIVTALNKTIQIQKKIDENYKVVER